MELASNAEEPLNTGYTKAWLRYWNWKKLV
jgi:hypothetical protein